MRYKIGNVLWGLAFILAGVGIGGNAFGLWSFNLFFDGWWTLFIIVPCIISVIQSGFNTGNSIGLAVGALLLLGSQNILDRHIVGKLFFPAILVIIGLAIVFGRRYHSSYKHGSFACGGAGAGGAAAGANGGVEGGYVPPQGEGDHHWNTSCGTDLTAIFCGNSGSFSGRECKGVACTAVFGGVDLDLRGAIITRNITVNATAIFGGIDIFVDEKVQVQYRSVPIFGGVSCNIPPRDASLPTVFINSVAIFGGVEIK